MNPYILTLAQNHQDEIRRQIFAQNWIDSIRLSRAIHSSSPLGILSSIASMLLSLF